MSDWAQIKENKKVGEGIYRLRLEAPAIAASARPGQFIMLRVSHGLDPLLARPFSIHGVEGDDLLILYKVVGKGTKLLSLKRPGNKTLSLWGPLGRGFDLEVERPILVGGGMGMAPLKFAADTMLKQGRRVTIISGAATKSSLVGGVEYVERYMNTDLIDSVVTTDDGSEGLHGLITSPLMQYLSKAGCVLACGPMPMLKAVALICAERQVPCQVSLEAPMACGLGACLGCVIPATGGGYLRACQEGPVLKAELVDWDRL
jgi:dihydroorotate dehydrogenase electron transfer subunit